MANELIVILSGVTGAAVIKLLDGVIQFVLARIAKRKDGTTDKQTDEMRRIAVLEGGLMSLLLDRIQHLCKSYIRNGSVDADDLRRLHIMHDKYHCVGGNGDLDKLMQRVDTLPLSGDN